MEGYSPLVSTPMVASLQASESSCEVKVPSPPMESELTRSEESAIHPPVYDGDDEMSVDRDASMTAQMGSNMEIPVEMEVTPYPTPGPASRTRSHDGQEKKLSAPQLSLQILMDEMDNDIRYIKEQKEEEKKQIWR